MNILNSFFWKFFERGCSQGINFIVQIILARLLAPSEFGNLAIVMALINISSIFIQNGISTAIVVKKDLDDEDISAILSSSLCVALIIYMVLYLLSPLLEKHYGLEGLASYVRLTAIVLFLYSFNSVYTGILERKMNFRSLFLRSIIAVPVSGGVGVCLALFGYGIHALIAQTIMNQLILAIILGIGASNNFRLSFSYKKIIYFYKFCLPVMVQSAIGELINVFKTFSISKVYSTNELAYYDRGYTYSNYVFQGINTPIIHVLLPAFSKYQGNSEALKRIYLKTLSVNNLVSLPLVIGFAAVSESFVRVFLTDKWIFAVEYICAFCVIRAIYVSINLNLQLLYVIKNSALVLKMSVITSVISFFLLLLTRNVSPLAIVIGEIIVTFFFLSYTIVSVKKIFLIDIREQLNSYWKSVLGVFIMYMGVRCIKCLIIDVYLCLFLQIIIGAIIYMVYSYFIQKEDIDFLKGYIKNRAKL